MLQEKIYSVVRACARAGKRRKCDGWCQPQSHADVGAALAPNPVRPHMSGKDRQQSRRTHARRRKNAEVRDERCGGHAGKSRKQQV